MTGEILEGVAWTTRTTYTIRELAQVLRDGVLTVLRNGMEVEKIPMVRVPSYGMSRLSCAVSQEWFKFLRPIPLDEVTMEVPEKLTIVGNVTGPRIKSFHAFWPVPDGPFLREKI